MRKRRSFRRRILVAVLGSGLVLAVAVAVSVVSAVVATEDEVQRQQLRAELDFLLQRDDVGNEKLIPVSRFMTAYVGLDAMPPALRNQLPGIAPFAVEYFLIFRHVEISHKAGPGCDKAVAGK